MGENRVGNLILGFNHIVIFSSFLIFLNGDRPCLIALYVL